MTMNRIEDSHGIRFRRGDPSAFVGRFSEIQELRMQYYTDVFANQALPQDKRRTEQEIAHYVGRLSRRSFVDPNFSVGRTARSAQRRADPIVTAAFDDETDRLLGFTYMAKNVSSKAEALLTRKLHVPARLAAPVGNAERAYKLRYTNNEYVWGSEVPHVTEHQNLDSVLIALGLEAYNLERAGTWFPYDEEIDLKERLSAADYQWNAGGREPIKGDMAFGGNSEAHDQLWRVSQIGHAIVKLEQIPGVADMLHYARESLAA